MTILIATLLFTTILIGWMGTAARVARLRHWLRTDPLTGTGNRAALREAFDRTSLTNGRCMAVLMLDLNGFKAINDTWGHRFGDAVLAEVAQRLREHEERGQLAVRLSGDEFAFWGGTFDDGPDNARVAADLAQKLAHSIAERMVVEGRTVHVSASIGTATTTVKPDSLEGFLELADRAMYRDKSRHPISRRLSGKGA